MSFVEDIPEPLVYVGVITDPHSAGKTTLLDDFNRCGHSVETAEILRTSENASAPWFSSGLLHIESGPGIPFVSAQEAATLYAIRESKFSTQQVTTSDYSFEHQIMIEGLARQLLIESALGAQELAMALPAQPDGRRIALALNDRSVLDGPIYSRIRTPDSDQDNISTAEVTKKVLGFNSGGVEGYTFPYRKLNELMMRQYCDFAVITDHSDIPLIDNGFRETDVSFRDQVAADTRSYYAEVLGSDRLFTVRGDRQARLEQLLDIIDRVIGPAVPTHT